MTAPTSSNSTCPRDCTRITLRLRKQRFMSCTWLNWRRKDLRLTGRIISVTLSTCSVSLTKPKWGMKTHPMMRPTYLIVPTLLFKGTGWTLKITIIVSVRVVLGKGTTSRNVKMRRPTMNMSEQPCIPTWLQWPLYVLCSSGDRYLRLQPVPLHL